MTLFETAHLVEAYRDRCEDRLEVIADADRTVLIVADGAGGSGDGHLAAESVIREAKANYASMHTPDDWSHFLAQLDFNIGAGESTAVIADLRSDRVFGASVGDSCAWIHRLPSSRCSSIPETLLDMIIHESTSYFLIQPFCSVADELNPSP